MAGYDVRITAEGKKNGARDTLLQDDYALYLKEAGMTRWDYLKLQGSTSIYGVYDWPFADSLHIDNFIGNQSVRFIQKDSLPQPWFMWVSFCGPHNPWDPPARYTSPYLTMNLPKARSLPGELASKPPDHTRVRYNYTGRLPKYMESVPDSHDSIIHRIRAGHYGNLTMIDEQLGLIIESLKARMQLKNTLIVFSSDHGAHLGDHENIHKGTHYERSAHVPMIAWFPGFISPGRTNSFSAHVDLMPTFLNLAGIVPPESLDGEDLWPLMLDQNEVIKPHVYNEIRGTYSIITHHYKLGITPGDSAADLYDREDDPDELHNLYGNEAYQPVIDSLLQLMAESRPWLLVGWPYE